MERGETTLERAIANRDRSVGAALSGWLVANHEPRAITINFTGVAGQSFGAFLAKGVEFNLVGEANDYVGKSLSGGVITIKAQDNKSFRPEDNVIAGNVIAYGATSGAIYVNGQAGERFGIRNSGATLVAEGVGDHGCEYMTGGTAVVLGPVGVNFAAAARGPDGSLAVMFANPGEEEVPLALEIADSSKRTTASRCRIVDETRTWEEAPLPAALPPHSILLVEFA